MKSSDFQRVWHMKGYAEGIADAIIRFGKDFEIFSSDSDYYDSVSMKLMQIGELCGGLSPEFKEATKDKIPWGAIRGMRNFFAHNYISMDKSIIWDAATIDAPIILAFCEGIIVQHGKKFSPFDPMANE
ncbi:MAG: DUF86 domain-containing protein [Clostridiales bacterium]|jgi:uncharacterized protein with HEPN domain|nr:DUF86 domain-containing protein [Clostridiales bacterium]